MLRRLSLALLLLVGLGLSACGDDDYGKTAPTQDLSAVQPDLGAADSATGG